MKGQKIKPKQGSLLISEPFLHDPFFKRSVVLVTEHNDEGSVGFILNKPINIKIHDALDDFPTFNGNLYMGGPVQRESLYYIHTKGDIISNSREILEGVYWGGDFETIKIMIENNEIDESELRFFMGYSGWGKEQLDNELNNKSWIVLPAKGRQVMKEHPDKLWSIIMKKLGNKYAVLANFPEQPSMN